MKAILPIVLICQSLGMVSPTSALAEAGVAKTAANAAIGFPKRPERAQEVARRADEIVEIYKFISKTDCPQTKAFAVSIMARNGALARGVGAGKGAGS